MHSRTAMHGTSWRSCAAGSLQLAIARRCLSLTRQRMLLHSSAAGWRRQRCRMSGRRRLHATSMHRERMARRALCQSGQQGGIKVQPMGSTGVMGSTRQAEAPRAEAGAEGGVEGGAEAELLAFE